jgi:hypothetical protein
MNIKKVSLDNKRSVLVNFDNVTEIYEKINGGCEIYFNTMSTPDAQAYIQVRESMRAIELIINNGDSK